MFLDNKYTNAYYRIVDRAKNRVLEENESVEKHHIIPKSFGGTDDEDNMVTLYPREHFVAHHLLTKMCEGKYKSKMTYALHTFFHFNKHRRLNFTARQYEFHKQEFSKACRQPKIKRRSKEIYVFKHRKTGEEFTGTRKDFIHHAKITDQECQFLITTYNREDSRIRYIKDWGIWIDRIDDWSYNKKIKPFIVPDKTCEHCGKTVSLGNYSRWHGDNCKKVDAKGHDARTRQISRLYLSR